MGEYKWNESKYILEYKEYPEPVKDHNWDSFLPYDEDEAVKKVKEKEQEQVEKMKKFLADLAADSKEEKKAGIKKKKKRKPRKKKEVAPPIHDENLEEREV